jgi:L-alanine-DL-glutamate epimerase-like enolase superfamily enzyme
LACAARLKSGPDTKHGVIRKPGRAKLRYDAGVMNRRSLLKSLAALPVASALGKVKITGFEIHKVSVRWRDLMFVEVHTDAGITGLGEATLESRTDIAESVLRWLEPEYVGLDPAGPEAHWDRVYYVATRWRNGPALMCRNFVIHECEGADSDLFREMTDGTYPTQKDGRVRLPDTPGLGIKVNFTEFERKCPYKAIRSRAQLKL